MVNVLVPGISTLSSSARHFALYWALADFATAGGLDAAACQTLVRRAESTLAWASLINPQTGDLTGPADMHGADTVRRRLAEGKAGQLSTVGKGSYSTRNLGYWGQYKGPAVTLGIASSDKNAIRAGRHPCPPALRDMFQQLFTVVARRPVVAADVAALTPIAQTGLDAPDVAPVRALMTATRDGAHNPGDWVGNDLTRRSTLRILARAVQLQPAQHGWRSILSNAVAYGEYLDTDPVYVQESARAQAWRGLLLRHRSVGAWRLLWSALVDQVLYAPEPIGKSELHVWIRDEARAVPLAGVLAGLPDTIGPHGHPLPAEDLIDSSERSPVEAALLVLLLGSRRIDELNGEALAAFRGGPNAPRRAYLDPHWVAARARDHEGGSLADFACGLVDDMLAQSHRIALRKLSVKADGRVEMPTKLHEREGRYFADSAEGSNNIGYRAETIGEIAVELGLFTMVDGAPQVTDTAREILDLP